MPKILRINNFDVHKKKNVPLFTKKREIKPLIIDNWTHLTNDFKLNSVTQLALNLIDKLTPMINKHPKIGKVVVLSFEKFILVSEKISK